MPDRKKGPSPKMHARASSPREQAFPVVGLGASAGGVPADAEAIIEQLAGELRTTREHLKATAEQYHASNEELSSSNEELQSINEELRSTTEEIVAVNREFEVKIEELARANSDLQNLMAATEIGTIFLSRDLCIERFTPPVEQLFNITTADVGRPLAHFTHTLGYPELLDEARQVLHRLGPVVREVRSEAGRWYLVRLRPYRMAEDRVDGVVITFVDFAERRQAEATSQRLAAIVESSEDAIIGITLEGVITSWNRGAVRMYGYAAEDTVGKPITLVVPAERQEEVARFLAVIKRGEWVERVETVRRRRDGSRLEVSLSISPVYDRQGMLLGASTIARDITERKEAEAALRESQTRAQAVLDTTVDAVLTIDERGLIESVNLAAEQLFGYTAREVIGQNVKLLMPSPYREEHDHYLRSYLKTGEKKIIGIGREVVARRKDGSVFPVELSVSEVHLGNRRIFTGFIRDISERRRLEQEVLRISEEERQHIGQDIHDGLASQFSGIALMSRALVNRLKKEQPVGAEMLEEIAHHAQMGAGQARALARGLSPVKLDREGLTAALKELAQHAETLSGLAYTFEADEVLPPLKSEVAAQLYRIAQEAISNAIKHAGATHLLLRVHTKGDRLLLSVRDDGTGMPEGAREGDGMGLHIMPYRARMIGGALSIESALGEGTTVTCLVPVDEGHFSLTSDRRNLDET